jgi:hypothetical protein
MLTKFIPLSTSNEIQRMEKTSEAKPGSNPDGKAVEAPKTLTLRSL